MEQLQLLHGDVGDLVLEWHLVETGNCIVAYRHGASTECLSSIAAFRAEAPTVIRERDACCKEMNSLVPVALMVEDALLSCGYVGRASQ